MLVTGNAGVGGARINTESTEEEAQRALSRQVRDARLGKRLPRPATRARETGIQRSGLDGDVDGTGAEGADEEPREAARAIDG